MKKGAAGICLRPLEMCIRDSLHGALPGAVAADDGDEVPVVEGEGQIVEGDLLIHGTGIEDLGHMAHFKHDGSLL